MALRQLVQASGRICVRIIIGECSHPPSSAPRRACHWRTYDRGRIFAVVACIALAIAAFVVVNHARVYAQMVKANAEIAERAANYQGTLNALVDRRVEIVNEMAKKISGQYTKPLGPPQAEAPLPDEVDRSRPYLLDEAQERVRELAEAAPFHADSMRRDNMSLDE